MSDMYGAGPGIAPGAASDGSSGTVDTAKHEASEVKDTAAAETKEVVSTGKAEAAEVVQEATSQVKDLYAQTQHELGEQAARQQERVAGGLRSVGDELSTMADGAETPGLGADLVREASARLSGVASWLGDRDPSTLLDDVKAYARRKPGTFIAIAAVAGLVAGRLVRALGDNAADQKKSTSDAGAARGSYAGQEAAFEPGLRSGTSPADALGGPHVGDVGATPVYDQSRAAWGDVDPGEGGR